MRVGQSYGGETYTNNSNSEQLVGSSGGGPEILYYVADDGNTYAYYYDESGNVVYPDYPGSTSYDNSQGNPTNPILGTAIYFLIY